MSEHEENLQADIEEYERALDRKQDRIEELYRGLLEAEEYMEGVLDENDERLVFVRSCLKKPRTIEEVKRTP